MEDYFNRYKGQSVLEGRKPSRFSRGWDILKRRLVKKKWYGSSIILIIALAVGPAIGIGLETLGVGGTHEPLHVVSVDGNTPREGLFLYGGIRKWDMDEKALTVRWMPHQCGASFGAPPPDDCRGLDVDMNFYVGGDALGIGGYNESNAILQFQAALQGYLGFGYEQSIDMTILEQTRSGQINVNGLESDALYPFDWRVLSNFKVLYIDVSLRYKVQFLIAAQSPTSNKSIEMGGASIFNPDSSQWIAKTNYEYLDTLNDGTSVPAKLAVFIVLRRHIVVKISAFLLLIFNWIVTVALLYMTVMNVFGRVRMPEGMDAVALLFAGLFALPSVRSVMPGDPPFGCLIDFIGILPNLVIISGCATSLLVSRILRESKGYIPINRTPSSVSEHNWDVPEKY
ncbi:hypothetical protein SCHPADRAFT_838995 [Schizopora paradoxa]|uniref:Uncharacterized protein n=1 Tax=Schizopora paradoxa TaxID=27342 RepID=A0A0H2RLL5_9AGAM|nr:hypothetical protein SCHPADRAFT_838995 [Schizopora paradoxa]